MTQSQAEPKLYSFDEFISWYPENSEVRYELHDSVQLITSAGFCDRPLGKRPPSAMLQAKLNMLSYCGIPNPSKLIKEQKYIDLNNLGLELTTMIR
ncbi:hypothetical protein NIES2119_22820 [[Phormidium ambiguum] IAM M-71]|uniref:Uncharacterized protein n=1 Tax=[Phormidium ambiguum] IAM M-71 TaxID=454136 RepID=A0A1U7IAI0_9CYAN|nr:hypothetical protein [Phormidium ambiguum]OKH33585.1 hypothetical protein NIES2119_22820 [Phormidium ambiguum IAM M-71]